MAVATGWALNAVRVFENAKSVRKCVRFGLACVRLHAWECSVLVRFGVRVHVRVRCSCSVFVFMFVVQFYENLQILPMGNVRHFRRIRKNETLFSENVRCPRIFSEFVFFCRTLVNLCVFRSNLVNYLENI